MRRVFFTRPRPDLLFFTRSCSTNALVLVPTEKNDKDRGNNHKKNTESDSGRQNWSAASIAWVFFLGQSTGMTLGMILHRMDSERKYHDQTLFFKNRAESLQHENTLLQIKLDEIQSDTKTQLR